MSELFRVDRKVASVITTAHLIPELIEGGVLVPVEPTDLWDDKTIADAQSLLEDSDENRDLVADILAVAARQFDVVPEGEQR